MYLHFGKSIIAQQTRLPEHSDEVCLLWEKIYADFVEALDAHDNGISVYDPAETQGLNKRFHDGGIGLGSLVGDLNDSWSDDSAGEESQQKSAEQIQHEEDVRFLKASTLIGTSFLRKLRYYHRAWLPARTYVHEAYAVRKKYDKKGRIIVFERGLPWKDHLYSLEAEHPMEEEVAYVLYPEGSHEGSKWRIQAVGTSKDSFQSRQPLPENWRGLRDDALDKVTGIEGCVFVHAAGFIGGNKTFHGVMEMAWKSVN